ncbi:O-antigen ligase [Microbacterium sp. SORGH_AS_0862]|uniref:O-antigen ligase family protein n=1 Tax=Microbacterium sp. SORGH_AS_0862 TaxID=3041789 RepID=UPI0027903CF0|nr:O-antigen ligase family protein [Microbacterium sp. SORGH_AS_0862]MDQ1205653.1 hypothetical protein [Microbacterium sp. SORGH_AS_0862]
MRRTRNALSLTARWSLYGALFTIGWDRLANVSVMGFNVKVPILLFALSLVLGLIEWIVMAGSLEKARRRWSRWDLTLGGLILAALLVLVASSLLSEHPASALLQCVTVVLGAVVPFVAVVVGARLHDDLADLLRAFIAGGMVAAVFGLYQLLAALVDWPQLIEYEALGGGSARISSFLYEAGYFGYYMVLVVGAVIAYDRLRSRTTWFSMALIAALVLVTILANTRAAYLTLPLLLVALGWPYVGRLRRFWPWVAGAVAAAVALVFLLPGVFGFLWERFTSIFDPTEESSNAPRLEWIDRTLRISADHPLLGIGPGNLFYVAPRYGGDVTGGRPNSIIANNAFLQALLDGGILLLLCQLAVVAVIVWQTYRLRRPVSQALIGSWLSVAIVALFITSYYWDLKLWAVAALAWAATGVVRAPRRVRSAEQEPS